MFDFEVNNEPNTLVPPMHIDISRSQSQRSGFGQLYDEDALSPTRLPEFYEPALDDDLTIPLSAHELRQLDEGEMPVESDGSLEEKEEFKQIDDNGFTQTKINIKKKAMTRSIFTIDEEDEGMTVMSSMISKGIISCD